MIRGRGIVVIVLIVALLATGATQYWVRSTHDRAVGRVVGGAASASSLSSMNSFSLALLLGGLRGPLVMFLWMTSETQKNEKNLEDFDTRVEWIRLLQPEFDTVHIFQVWNKAYNISVQMASLANKYTTILDALEYAKSVDRERPNNINMVSAIGGTYFDKLGNSAEKNYYIGRVRQETLPRKEIQNLRRTDPGWRPLQVETMLDADGNLDGPGKDLTYLEKYQPFPYGLSPIAIAYDYYKRAQLLQNEKKQSHIQLSDLVIDSRPGTAIRLWSEEEWARARQRELALFGKAMPEERIQMETPTAGVTPDATFDSKLSAEQIEALTIEALYSYARAARLAEEARGEYEQHVQRFDANRLTYQSQLEHLRAVEQLIRGDRAYLQAIVDRRRDGSAESGLLAESARHYRAAIPVLQRIILRYYTEDGIAQTSGYDRANLDSIPDEQLPALLTKTLSALRFMQFDTYSEDRNEYLSYLQRAQTRLENLPTTG